MSYTRGNDLSGSMEGAGLPRQSEASAGGIGGLLARSAGYSCSDSTLTVSITNESSIDCIFWIYSDAGTNVDGEVVSAGSDRTFTFSAVGGVQYTVWGTDNRFHELGIVNTWTATLDHHALDLGSEDPDPEDATATDFGSVLCADSDIWPHHDYYFADGNGNIVTLIDTNQAVSASYRYDPFGNITTQSGAMADANVYRFSSKEFHVASGMYSYTYRFYDSSLARWINRDPIAEAGGINLYEFDRNNPANQIDLLGLIGNPVSGPNGPIHGGTYLPPIIAPPIYNPGFWNDPSRQPFNNCYLYACDQPRGGFGSGGGQPGGPYPPGMTIDCASLRARVKGDGAVDPDKCANCPTGTHKIRLWANNLPQGNHGDFHFSRQDASGSWSDKPGQSPARLTPDANSYGNFQNCGDLCVANQPLN